MKCPQRKAISVLARYGLLLGLGICAAEAGEPAREAEGAVVTLQGQRKFLDGSIDFCIERVPALKVELTAARARAVPQIQKAEAIIAEQLAGMRKQDRPLLDLYTTMWSKTADDLLESLKKQRVESACPTLRDNWLGIEADVIVEDWQNFLDRNLPEPE